MAGITDTSQGYPLDRMRLRRVREALDLFLRELERIDAEREGALLRGYSVEETRQAGIALVVRLLFLLFAEARGLLPAESSGRGALCGVHPLLEELESARPPADRAPAGADSAAGPTSVRDFVAREMLRPLRATIDASGDPAPPPAEALGYLYEALLADEAGQPSGVHYTPPSLAELVVRRTLEPLVYAATPGDPAGPRVVRSPQEILDLRVCDPAVGSGVFLLQAVRYLAARLLEPTRQPRRPEDTKAPGGRGFAPSCLRGGLSDGLSSLKSPVAQRAERLVAERCIRGVDRNPLAVEVARLSLWLETGGGGDPFTFLGDALRSGDSLAGVGGGEGDSLSPFREGSFQAVVGNPPWISFSGRRAHLLSPTLSAYYSAEYSSFRGWRALHPLFLERALRLVAPGGRIGLLLPAQVCDLVGYGPLRALARSTCVAEEPFPYFGEEAFPGVTQPCCCMLLERRGSGPVDDGRPFTLAVPGAPPTGGAGGWQETLLDRLRACARPPKDAFADVGVHTGNCRRKLIREGQGPGGAPIREGRDVIPYNLLPPRRSLLLGVGREPGEYFRVGSMDGYLRVRILLRQTALRPIAALHQSPTYFRNSVLACRGIEGIEDEVVVAWLNSSLVAWFHRRTVREAGQRAFPQLKVGHLRALPVPDWASRDADLAPLATAVAREHRMDLEPELDRRISRLFGVDDGPHEQVRAGVPRRVPDR